MSLVNVINVIAHNAKSQFSTNISFEIFFEALQPLQHGKYLQDLINKTIYYYFWPDHLKYV